MSRWGWLILFLCSTCVAAGSGGVNAPDQRGKPYLVLVSIDGFRWDYQDLFDTPALDRIAAGGVRAERLVPVFPTLTFPNHYSIATGLYPENHGLIGNRFPSTDRSRFYNLRDRAMVQDGSWYGGEPVWVAAERAGLVTAAYFYVGTEADIGGIPMTYWHAFDDSVPGTDRVDKVIDWLAMPEDKRPHLLTLYFEDVDTITHRYGPGSPESVEAITRVDGYLGRLMRGIEQLPIADDVYVVVISDHGQLALRRDVDPFVIESVADLDGLQVVDHTSSAYVYFPAPDPGRARAMRDAVNKAWEHGSAYTADDAPPAWRVSRDGGFADVILVAEPGFMVFSTMRDPPVYRSSHGWAPEVPGMHGIFLASGPGLPDGRRIGPVDAVDIYPLLMRILGLPVSTPIDGDPGRIAGLLAR